MNVASVRRKGTAKGQKVRPQIWNAQKERQRTKGCRAKSDRNGRKDENGCKGLQANKARHGKTLQAHKMNMRMNIHTYTQKQCTHENILPTYTI